MPQHSYSYVHPTVTIAVYPTQMRKCVVVLLALLLLLPAAPTAHADAYQAKPKLVVILVIDQFRGDLLDRYRDTLVTPNGFNLFLKKGAYFNSCYFDYANTKTAPGHATIGTGAYTNGHGAPCRCRPAQPAW